VITCRESSSQFEPGKRSTPMRIIEGLPYSVISKV
jgi:hypothetical protein